MADEASPAMAHPPGGGDRGTVACDGPRHRRTAGAWPAQHAARDAAGRSPEGRCGDGNPDLLRVPVVLRRVHRQRRRRRGALRRRRRPHDVRRSEQVRVAGRNDGRLPPRGSAAGGRADRARRAARQPPAKGRQGRSSITSPRPARWPGCSPTGSVSTRPWEPYSATSPSGGTARASQVVRRATRYRCRCGSFTSPETPRSSGCSVAPIMRRRWSAGVRGTRSIPTWSRHSPMRRPDSWRSMRRRPGTKRLPANRGRTRSWKASRSTEHLLPWPTSAISSRPYFVGHSTGVAVLAVNAARRCRFDIADLTTIRRAALIHDIGRVAVPARIWQQPGPLTPDDWEKVRLHPYQTERILHRSPFLAVLAGVAGCPPRALRRVGLSPWNRRSRTDTAGTPARRGGRLSDEDRTEAAPSSRSLRSRPPRRSPARSTPGGWMPSPSGRCSRPPASRAPRIERPARPDAARDRRHRPAGARVADQADRTCAGNLGQDGRQPHPERVQQDRRVHACGGRTLRDAARPGAIGRTPYRTEQAPRIASRQGNPLRAGGGSDERRERYRAVRNRGRRWWPGRPIRRLPSRPARSRALSSSTPTSGSATPGGSGGTRCGSSLRRASTGSTACPFRARHSPSQPRMR